MKYYLFYSFIYFSKIILTLFNFCISCSILNIGFMTQLLCTLFNVDSNWNTVNIWKIWLHFSISYVLFFLKSKHLLYFPIFHESILCWMWNDHFIAIENKVPVTYSGIFLKAECQRQIYMSLISQHIYSHAYGCKGKNTPHMLVVMFYEQWKFFGDTICKNKREEVLITLIITLRI